MSDFTGASALSVMVLSLVGGMGLRAVRHRRERRRARKDLAAFPELTPEMPEGAVARVTGVVRVLDDNQLIAPLSGQPCVAYRARVQGYREMAASPLVHTEARPFGVGDVIVDGRHARFALAPVKLVPSRAQTTRYDAFVARFGRDRHSFTGGAVFDEVIVEPERQVTVVGVVMHDLAAIGPSDELGFRDHPARIVCLGANKDHPLVIGD
jgi:hypothetical protein